MSGIKAAFRPRKKKPSAFFIIVFVGLIICANLLLRTKLRGVGGPTIHDFIPKIQPTPLKFPGGKNNKTKRVLLDLS